MTIKENIFDLQAMMDPVRATLEEYYTEEKSLEISKELETLVLNHLEKAQCNRLSQERSFYVELHEDMRLFGDIQFLLIQAGKYNILQAIGWKASLVCYGEETRYNVWKNCDYSPKVLVYWNGSNVEIALNESAKG